jgi:hypothetical protein
MLPLARGEKAITLSARFGLVHRSKATCAALGADRGCEKGQLLILKRPGQSGKVARCDATIDLPTTRSSVCVDGAG